MSHEEIAKRLEKAMMYILQTAKLCRDSEQEDLQREVDSLIRLANLLKMSVGSVKRAIEHRARMAEYDKRLHELHNEVGTLSSSMQQGEERIKGIIKQGKEMCKLDPNSDNFRQELAKIDFNDPIMDEAVKAFANGDDEKAFKTLEGLFKPKH